MVGFFKLDITTDKPIAEIYDCINSLGEFTISKNNTYLACDWTQKEVQSYLNEQSLGDFSVEEINPHYNRIEDINLQSWIHKLYLVHKIEDQLIEAEQENQKELRHLAGLLAETDKILRRGGGQDGKKKRKQNYGERRL